MAFSSPLATALTAASIFACDTNWWSDRFAGPRRANGRPFASCTTLGSRQAVRGKSACRGEEMPGAEPNAVLSAGLTAWLDGGKPTELKLQFGATDLWALEEPTIAPDGPTAAIVACEVPSAAGAADCTLELFCNTRLRCAAFTEQPCIGTAASAVRDGALDSTRAAACHGAIVAAKQQFTQKA